MEEMLVLSYKEVSLRELEEKNIRDYIDWFTIKTDWQKWEAPWNELDVEVDQLEEKLLEYINMEKPALRKRFEIYYRDSHVGWTNSYYIDGEEDMLAIGVVIPDKEFWARGIGEKALICYIRYILEKDPYKDIYVETFEENERMINLAEKLGFETVPLIEKYQEVDGEKMPMLTMKLTTENIERYRI